jgi:hypothetical protein
MIIKELDIVALTLPVPEYGLVAGDVGTVVMTYEDASAFTIEFVTVTGKTIGIVTVGADAVRPVGDSDVSHARRVA